MLHHKVNKCSLNSLLNQFSSKIATHKRKKKEAVRKLLLFYYSNLILKEITNLNLCLYSKKQKQRNSLSLSVSIFRPTLTLYFYTYRWQQLGPGGLKKICFPLLLFHLFFLCPTFPITFPFTRLLVSIQFHLLRPDLPNFLTSYLTASRSPLYSGSVLFPTLFLSQHCILTSPSHSLLSFHHLCAPLCTLLTSAPVMDGMGQCAASDSDSLWSMLRVSAVSVISLLHPDFIGRFLSSLTFVCGRNGRGGFFLVTGSVPS